MSKFHVGYQIAKTVASPIKHSLWLKKLKKLLQNLKQTKDFKV